MFLFGLVRAAATRIASIGDERPEGHGPVAPYSDARPD
jgi:hypothetical protein